MYCPECGLKVDEDTNFCYSCGANLNADSTDTLSEDFHGQYRIVDIRPPDKKVIYALIVAVLIVSASVFGFIYWISPDKEDFMPTDFVLYGDGSVGSGVISIVPHDSDDDFTDESATVTFTCNVNTLGNYQWGIISLDESKYYVDKHPPAESGHAVFERSYNLPDNTVSSNDGKSITCTLDPGYYSVIVGVNFQQYEGTFALGGEVMKTYSWDFIEFSRPDSELVKEEHSFEMDFSFQYSECISALKYEGPRGITDIRKLEPILSTYVADGNSVTESLEEKLKEEFDSKGISPHYKDGDNYNYISYLLTFVQLNIRYYPSELPENVVSGLTYDDSSDYMIYGSEEYWAFPTQTLMQGVGDCEDTSFLAAALFKAAGLDAAVAIIPGHAVAGVHMEDDLVTEPPTYPIDISTPDKGPDSYIIRQHIGDKTYYGCETTTSFQYLVGYTNLTYLDDVSGEYQELTYWVPGDNAGSEGWGFYKV